MSKFVKIFKKFSLLLFVVANWINPSYFCGKRFASNPPGEWNMFPNYMFIL